MDSIIEHGCYQIGIKDPVICKNQNEVIGLSLEVPDKKKFLRAEFTLEDLRDLESKLVLITGRDAEKRKTVDLFVNVSDTVLCHDSDIVFLLPDLSKCTLYC